MRDAAGAVRLAAYLEDGVTRAYLGLVAVSDQRLRRFGAMAMQEAADRAVAWRGRTQAFPGLGGLGSAGSGGTPDPPDGPELVPGGGQSLRSSEASTRTIVLAARSTSSATAIRSAHDHQNHHKPSLPQPT